MLLRKRVPARAHWSRHHLVATALTVSLLVPACTGRSPRQRDSREPSPTSQAAPAIDDGGAAGQRGESSAAENDAGGSHDAGGPVAEPTLAAPTEPEMVDEPSIDEPSVDEPSVDEPSIDEPSIDEPSRGAGQNPDPIGLPCEVQSLLRSRCQGCHSNPPLAGASIPLVSYADLTARSKHDVSVSVAARCLKRMQDSLRPMPPAPATPVTISELRPLQTWLEAGAAPGSCEERPGADPYAASVTCTSAKYWTAIDSGSPWMNPGRACIQCHRQYPGFAPLFTVAGTVFPTAHEPDKCFGVPLTIGAQVVITDANGRDLTPIAVVSGGNFNAIVSQLALPYRAKVVVGDRERVMLTPQTSGDCNLCHSQAGSQGARGRIILP